MTEVRILTDLVEAQIARTPHAPALRFGDTQRSYEELEERSNRWAHFLRSRGVGPGVPVAVALERSLELPTVLLAVLKAGGAYLPLDPGYPADRLSFMLQDALGHLDDPVLITQESLLDRLPTGDVRPLCVDADWQTVAWEDAERPEPSAQPQDLAYVIYTSGSTGRPKGVLCTHEGIASRLLWMQDAYGLTPEDRVLQKTPYSFDVSVWEFFWPLLAGATLVVAKPEGHKDAAYLARLIVDEEITTLHFVPSMLRVFLDEPGSADLPSMRRVICSGEALAPDLVGRFHERFPGVELHNLYGPTEASIDVTAWPTTLRDAAASSVPIGFPVARTEIRVLDPEGLPVAQGDAGELALGGIQVARGYLRRPGLTASRFVPDPVSPEPGERLYRTGDLGRRRPDGAFEYLGRTDHQVKLRGFRIELGEIETVLGRHPAVSQAAVLVRDEPHAGPRLVAYLVADPERAVEAAPEDLYTLADGTRIVHLNRAETEMLEGEIFDEQAYLRHGVSVEAGDVVVDVGANVGLFSLFVHQRAPGARVLAFEPAPEAFAALETNVALAGIDARLYDCALGAEEGEAELTIYPRMSLMSGLHADPAQDVEVSKTYLKRRHDELARHADDLLEDRFEAQTVTRPVRTLSGVLAEAEVDRIDLLKIDAEKAEADVLAGLAEEDWARVRQAVVEVHDRDGRLEALGRRFEEHGFRVTVEQDPHFRGTELYNLYAVRPETTADRARRATEPRPAVEPSRALLTESELRAFLAERLPEHMVPSVFVVLDDLPRSPAGKLDRKALAARPEDDPRRLGVTAPHVPPEGIWEERLAMLWRDLLGVDGVGREDHFFDLGGHSLLATRLLARVRETLGIEASLRDVFDHPRLAEQAARLRRLEAEGGWAEPIRPVPRDGRLPLTSPQERIWFLQKLHPNMLAYQFQARFTLRGPLSLEGLTQALSGLIERHEIFRTTFPEVAGRPVQRIHEDVTTTVPWIDLSGLALRERAGEAERLIEAEFRHPCPPDRLPLMRWRVLRVAPVEHLVTHVEHHLVHDGWSFNVCLGDLTEQMRAFFAGRPPSLPDLPIQFADFAVWQRRFQESAEAERQLEYWRRRLAGCPTGLDLPTDRPRPARPTYRGKAPRIELPVPLCRDLRALARGEGSGVTLYMTLVAAYVVLLARYSGQTDLPVGCGIANRRWTETESLVGMIINTMVLRNDASGDPPFRELLHRVRDVTLGAYAHQDLPFERVVQALQPERSLALNPFFQVAFSFHDARLPPLDVPGVELEIREGMSNGSAKFDLNVIGIPRREQTLGRGSEGADEQAAEGITLIWEYALDLFDDTTALRMVEHFQTILEAVVADPDRKLSVLPLLTASQRHQLALEAGGRAAEETPAGMLLDRFVAQADRRPEAVAVALGSDVSTYGELAAAARRGAARLRAAGVRPGMRVGVCLERSPQMVEALLSILAAGGAYVPIDPTYPRERLAFLVEDSGVPVVLTSRSVRQTLEASGPLPGAARWMATDEEGGGRAVDGGGIDPIPVPPESLAYVIYTSGSTGRPKGVAVPHRAVVHFLERAAELSGAGPESRVLQLASLSFDASVLEIFLALSVGARLELIPREVLLSGEELGETLRRARITHLAIPPSLLDTVPSGDYPDLGWIVVGGEACGPDTARRWWKDRQLVNAYAPTEATVFATAGRVEAPDLTRSGGPPMGRPIEGMELTIRDRWDRTAPMGVAGEILLGGPGLARGYLGRPALTAERFVPHPGRPGARLYRTGDLGRWLPDGRVVFAGRVDDQVKIRGFRIEPGEVEAVLEGHPAVGEAAVLALGDAAASRRLVAYVVTDAPTAELEAFLDERLPPYMRPSAFVRLETLPLTSHGKVDRDALARVSVHAAASTEEPVPPRTAVEEILAEIWADVLEVDRVGARDDFFALGGHSLLITRVLARLEEETGVDLPPSVVFESSRLEELAEEVEAALLEEMEAAGELDELEEPA